jgi:hypothetical protein
VQRFVDVWKVIVRDVANELPVDFIVAHAAMKSAKKRDELDGRRSGNRQQGEPVDGHRSRLSRIKRDSPQSHRAHRGEKEYKV